MKPLFILLISVICLLVMFSCNRGQLSFHHFNENEWNLQDSIIFPFNITDTSCNYTLSLFFRNTIEYPYQNLFLLVETTHNNSIINKDTLEYLIANKYGQWLGRGLGDKKDNYFYFNSNTQFADSGQYKLVIQHGMRNNPLRGVNKLGFKIKKE